MLLKHTPSNIHFQAGLGKTKEPTTFSLGIGSHKTFTQWLASQNELAQKKRKPSKSGQPITDEISLEED